MVYCCYQKPQWPPNELSSRKVCFYLIIKLPSDHASKWESTDYGVRVLDLGPPILMTDMDWEVEPEEALALRHSQEGLEVLIRWKSLPVHKATWEPVKVQLQFPTSLQPGNIDGSSQPNPGFQRLETNVNLLDLDLFPFLNQNLTKVFWK